MIKISISNRASNAVPKRHAAGDAALAASNETKFQQQPQRARLDITETARRCGRLEVPTAMTAALWESIADGHPFAPEHEKVRELCAPLEFAFTHLLSRKSFEQAGGESFDCRFELCGKPCAIKVAISPTGLGRTACTIMLPHER